MKTLVSGVDMPFARVFAYFLYQNGYDYVKLSPGDLWAVITGYDVDKNLTQAWKVRVHQAGVSASEVAGITK